MYEYEAKVLRVVDGDTIDVDLDLGLYCHLHARLRLFGIDAWEVRGDEREAGRAAQVALDALIGGKQVVVRTHKGREKYGRFLATVFLGDVNVNRWLVDEGHAQVQ